MRNYTDLYNSLRVEILSRTFPSHASAALATALSKTMLASIEEGPCCVGMRRLVTLGVLILSFLPVTLWTQENRLALHPLTPVEVRPAVKAFAEKGQIPLEGIRTAGDSISRTGDQSVFLLELHSKNRNEQWLIRLTAGVLDQERLKSTALPEDTLSTTTGRDFHFTHTPAVLRVELSGPFSEGAKAPRTITATTVVSSESLELGLAMYCESAVQITRRIQESHTANLDYGFIFNMKKPDASAVERSQRSVAAFGLTADEERLYCGVYLTLKAFFAAANEIPESRALVEEVIQKPTFFSLVGNLGVSFGMNYYWGTVSQASPTPEGLPEPLYLFPCSLSLNGKEALLLGFAVTLPRPPLKTCAGIVSLTAQHPKDPSKYLILRLLSARPAATATTP